jgi:MHS family proline/betaine transporter-like MFS transporter
MESAHVAELAIPEIGADTPERVGMRAAVAAATGSAIEYYEFGVYGFTAAFLGPLFFPSDDPAAALLSTLAVFGSAFLMRPFGGILLGRFGDRFGRKAVLLATIIGMGAATGAIGLLPTASQVGTLAPLLLVLARLAQGFFAGGEVVGSAAFVAESAPPGRRGFFGAFTPVGVALGGALAATVCGTTTYILSPAQMSEWGWRVPFLLSLPLVVFSGLMRHNVEETPAFRRFISKGRPPRAPVRAVLAEQIGPVIKVILIAGGQNVGYWVGLVFMNLYLTAHLGYPKTQVYWIMAAIGVIVAAMMPFWGGLSDRWGRRKVLGIGFAAYIVLVIPMMLLMAQGDIWLAALALLVSVLPMPIVQSVGYPTYSEQFPTPLRYTGMAISINFGAMIGGGLTPYLSTWLLASTGNLLVPGFLLAGAAVIALATLTRLPETAGDDLA